VAEAVRGEQRAPARSRRVLLADDSATLRARLSAELLAAGFEVVTACDGQAALEQLEAGAFDAVVSDVQMPRRDGFAVAERCAGRLPCLLVTAEPSAAGERRARGLGVPYFAKDEALGSRVVAALSTALEAPRE